MYFTLEVDRFDLYCHASMGSGYYIICLFVCSCCVIGGVLVNQKQR
jgi:hypothetical protein